MDPRHGSQIKLDPLKQNLANDLCLGQKKQLRVKEIKIDLMYLIILYLIILLIF